MITIKNVLVATDFGEASQGALEYARHVARLTGATLHVLHVVRDVRADTIGVEGYTVDVQVFQKALEKAAREQLKAIVAADDRNGLCTDAVIVMSNSPARSIVSYAKDAHIDLIVLGTHGRAGVAHLLMGSVAERVVRTAPCPVLTVREPARDRKSTEALQAAVRV